MKTLIFDVMLNGRFVCTLRMKYCPLFHLTVEEICEFVDGYIEIVNLRNGEILVINEDGKDRYDTNKDATELAHQHHALFPGDYIDGDVVLCKDEEVQ